MDSARTAIRLGAENVYIVYRRSKKELPARIEEVHHAEEEGIQFHFLTLPVKILGNDEGWVTGMECQRMELGEPDQSGRRRPIPIPGSEFQMDVDLVIVAIGTGANPLIQSTTPDLQTNKWGYIVADPETGATSKKGVYAGGDIVTGSATVILAMGAGRKAADAIHKYLLNREKPVHSCSKTRQSFAPQGGDTPRVPETTAWCPADGGAPRSGNSQKSEGIKGFDFLF